MKLDTRGRYRVEKAVDAALLKDLIDNPHPRDRDAALRNGLAMHPIRRSLLAARQVLGDTGIPGNPEALPASPPVGARPLNEIEPLEKTQSVIPGLGMSWLFGREGLNLHGSRTIVAGPLKRRKTVTFRRHLGACRMIQPPASLSYSATEARPANSTAARHTGTAANTVNTFSRSERKRPRDEWGSAMNARALTWVWRLRPGVLDEARRD